MGDQLAQECVRSEAVFKADSLAVLELLKNVTIGTTSSTLVSEDATCGRAVWLQLEAMHEGTTNATMLLLTCKQTKQMSDSKNLETFRNRAEVYILFDGETGTSFSRVNAKLAIDAVDPENPTLEERILATTKVREEHLAILFIKNSDASKYGKRIMDLKVRYIEKNEDEGDPYPSTLAKALEMLETWEDVQKRTPRNTATHDESGISFNTDEDSTEHHPRSDGGRGHGGRGKGGGRSGRGGRGGCGNSCIWRWG